MMTLRGLNVEKTGLSSDTFFSVDPGRLAVMLFRLFYAMIIMLMLCFLDQEEKLVGSYLNENYELTTREIQQHRMVALRLREMNDRKIALAGESVLDRAIPGPHQLNSAMQDYQIPSLGIQWTNQTATTSMESPAVEKIATGPGHTCAFETRETLSNGIELADVVCNSPIILGPTRYISEGFYLPPELEHQYRFWYIVYSLMSANNYAIHSRVHPGVIFEVVNAQATAVSLNSPGIEGARAISSRVGYYTELLHKMQTMANHKVRFSRPEMQRIALAMSHIKAMDKYSRAADELRVQRGQREFLQKGLADSSMYMHWINKEFAEAGVPADLANLAFVESSFNINAVSKAGASGVFQIMPYVGRGYDMLVNESIDERNDPVKSARVAAHILSDYYARTGSWPLAVTAYNHGITSMLSAMKKLDTNSLVTIIDNYDKASFGFASKNYYTCFLAMLSVVKEQAVHFPDLQPTTPIGFETVTLTQKTDVSELLNFYGFDQEHLLFLNPDINQASLERGGFLPEKYELKVPQHRLLQLVMKGDEKQHSETLNVR